MLKYRYLHISLLVFIQFCLTTHSYGMTKVQILKNWEPLNSLVKKIGKQPEDFSEVVAEIENSNLNRSMWERITSSAIKPLMEKQENSTADKEIALWIIKNTEKINERTINAIMFSDELDIINEVLNHTSDVERWINRHGDIILFQLAMSFRPQTILFLLSDDFPYKKLFNKKIKRPFISSSLSAIRREYLDITTPALTEENFFDYMQILTESVKIVGEFFELEQYELNKLEKILLHKLEYLLENGSHFHDRQAFTSFPSFLIDLS